MVTFSVRMATQDDAEAIARAHVAGWRTAYRGFIPQGHLDAIDEVARARRWRELIAEGAGRTLVVEHTDVEHGDIEHGGFGDGVARSGVVGFGAAGRPPAEVEASPSDGYVYAVYVHPEAWGTGAAQVLLRGLETSLCEDGFAGARLSAIAGNVRARRFYEKAGWHTDGREQQHDAEQPGMPSRVTVTSVQYTKALSVGGTARQTDLGRR